MYWLTVEDDVDPNGSKPKTEPLAWQVQSVAACNEGYNPQDRDRLK